MDGVCVLSAQGKLIKIFPSVARVTKVSWEDQTEVAE